MRIFKILVGILCCTATTANAADAVLTWTAPTLRTDGSALTNLAGYRIRYGPAVGNYPTLISVPGAAVTTYTVTGLTGGTWYFVMLAYDAAGLESALTNPVSKVIAIAPPNPPGGFAVAGGVAFTLIRAQDRLVMLPVGTITGDTACLTDAAVVGGVLYSVVPTSAITYSGSVRPVVAFARCS